MRVDVWTESASHHANTHLPTRPISRSGWSSRSMSGADSASSFAGESTASSCAEAESAASLAPSSGSALEPPQTAETATTANKKNFLVALEAPVSGNRKLTAWVRKFVSRLSPSINDKNAVCMVKRKDGTPCNHLMKWSAG